MLAEMAGAKGEKEKSEKGQREKGEQETITELCTMLSALCMFGETLHDFDKSGTCFDRR